MISLHHLLMALSRERREVKRSARYQNSEYFNGIRMGLRAAMVVARKLYDETKYQRVPNPTGRKRGANVR